MSRFLIPILIAGVSIASFFLYTKPTYNEGLLVHDEVVKLEEAKIKLDEVIAKKQELINK